ncbi:hypothetical protein CYQ88_01785 [Hydrogenovibrio sp. SC-1]|uniref:hypothetical protein n=1 Tax=Hydrogenovibrio sp. SC-1 TaxID=2065820 RepID=UPI000C7AE647|nr:hypothetical protein [Hydrogenovibrio sp. SC-1]PLA75322.1 hypothetical protein CYQ88_01785 [Hydrogenovibrio sp. SC-1]
MKNLGFEPSHYVLKVSGKHNLVFKTKHNDSDYLTKVAKDLIDQPDGHFTQFEIHPSDHANGEMTQAEHFVRPHLSTEL